jgi:hypothetical protein
VATNLNTTLYERAYYSANEHSDPPSWFRHTPPAHPATPAAPTYPGTLNSFERAEVQRYLNSPTDSVLASLTLPAAITKANEYKTYYASPVIQAYLDAARATRKAQWQLFCADAIVASKLTLSPSSDDSGTGGDPPVPEIPPSDNIPP